jgi:hypothetical protein
VQLPGEGAPVQEEVDVAPSRDLGALDPGGAREVLDQLRGDVPGLAPEDLGEVERGGDGQVPQLHAGRVLEGDRLEGDVEGGSRSVSNRAGKALLYVQDHDL